MFERRRPLVAAQAGDPAVEPGEHARERPHLADVAAGQPQRDRLRWKRFGPVLVDQPLHLRASGERARRDAVVVAQPVDQLEGLLRQAAGVDGEDAHVRVDRARPCRGSPCRPSWNAVQMREPGRRTRSSAQSITSSRLLRRRTRPRARRLPVVEQLNRCSCCPASSRCTRPPRPALGCRPTARRAPRRPWPVRRTPGSSRPAPRSSS